jgi:YidC/Oxa1 family membrane protein insertase
MHLDVTLENLAAEPRRAAYDINGPVGLPSEDYNMNDVLGVLASFKGAPGPQASVSFKVVPAAKLADKGPLSAEPGARPSFAGAMNHYFASVLRPALSVPLLGAVVVPIGETSAGAVLTVGDVELAAAGTDAARATQSFILYCGPKTEDELAAFNSPGDATGFGALLNYGWFEPLVKIVLWLLKMFHKAIPNWGVAIILLTLLIRVAMHPLSRKSQVAMAKMQKLQPHIKKLQEKHKGDKQKLGQEQMKLMKEHGANPMGGCLPLLIQLPIFFALYRALSVSLDLRHAPFAFWIDNLSQPDHLLFLGVSLPLVGPWLNLLPILMAASMFVQQKMSPKPATPEAEQQAKIMGIFMPIFMGVILYNFASGLNLYILTSTLAGSFESWLIRRHLAAQDH